MVLREEWSHGTVVQTFARARDGNSRKFQANLQVTHHLINRLGLEKELVGHHGCVNCLEWNRDGTILASASDDLSVILWDPFRYKQKLHLSTGHTGNIFSVKFLSPSVLATCAADFSVRVHDVAHGRSRAGAESGDTPIMVCTCHCGRVKRLATAPDNPYLMWSAGEDGFILQHDIRTSHTCNSDHPIVLVNLLNHLGRFAEAKCVAVNPRRPELIAVGANDFYVRMYDRRMIKLSQLHYMPSGMQQHQNREPILLERMNYRCSRAAQGDKDNNIPRECVQFFAPGHLSALPDNSLQKKATTYLTFSADGNELLVNMGSEHVYLFEINGHRRPQLLESYIIEHNHGYKGVGPPSNGFNGKGKMDEKRRNGTCILNGIKPYILPSEVKTIKETANKCMSDKNYIEAVDLYSIAISKCPDCAILYANRAAALIRRNWIGDMYAAIRDCYTAVKLDPSHVKSHFRIAKALMELQKPREAHECLLYLKAKFPKNANCAAVTMLQKDVSDAISGMDTPEDEEPEEPASLIMSALEKVVRQSATDYSLRFLGHCNTTTDIKEANFLDSSGNFIAAGSDDGAMYIWDRKSGCTVRALQGDDHILNCIQPHPSTCLIATSGIDPVVRLWSPRGEQEEKPLDPRLIRDTAAASASNQNLMRADPFEAMILNMTYTTSTPRTPRDTGMNANATCRAS